MPHNSNYVSCRPHHNDNPSYRKVYDENVEKIQMLFEQTLLDPFYVDDPSKKLFNFGIGVSFDTEIACSLLDFYDSGSRCLEKSLYMKGL